MPLLILMTLSMLGSTIGFLISTNATRNHILDGQLNEDASRVVAELSQSKRDVFNGATALSRDPQLIEAIREVPINREASLLTIDDRVVIVRDRFRLDQVIIFGNEQASPWANVTTLNELSQMRIYENPMLTRCHEESLIHLVKEGDIPVLTACAPIRAAVTDEQGTRFDTIGQVYTVQHVPRTLERIHRELGLRSEVRLAQTMPPEQINQFQESGLGEQAMVSVNGYRVRSLPVNTLDQQENLRLFLLQSEQEIREIVGSGFQVMLVSSGLTLVLLMVVGYVLAQGFSRPILKLVNVARSVATGDFSQRADLKHHDEIGQLGRVFDQATSTITELLDQRARRAGELQAILQSMGDGVLAIDMDERIVMVNPTAASLLGQSPAALLNRSLNALTNVEDPVLSSGLEHIIEQVRNELTDPNRDQTEEHISLGERIVRLQSAPILGSKNSITGAVVVIQDITESVEADRAKSAFIATASHEMRTPLTAMRGFVDIFMMSGVDNLTENQRTFLTTIKRQTENMVQMVNDLLEMARLEQGSLRAEHQWVTVKQVVDEVLNNLSQQVSQREVSVEVHLAPDLPGVWIDVLHMRRIMTNLISNSIKYVYQGGHVEIRGYTLNDPLQLPSSPGEQPWKSGDEHSVVIQVSDDGVGISERDQPKIFTRFFRSENPLTVEAGGSGLGLAITRSLVHLHNGQIGFRSAENEGSCFWVRFPSPTIETLTSEEKNGDEQHQRQGQNAEEKRRALREAE
jgi:PAS domain S-box-containing protein